MPEPTPSRRDLLRAGTAVAGAAALAGCGGGGGSAPTTGSATASTGPTADPVQVLDGVLAVEHTTVYAYGLGASLLGAVTAPLAAGFRQSHADHRDRLAQLIRSLGGTPSPARPSYDVGTPPTDEQGMVTLLASLEEEATRAHYAALRQIGDPALLQTLGSIMADEAEHAAALRIVLREDPAPASFVST
jgi:hypothetical protein